ncbi:MAG: PAS domain S-box protein [Candidatus Marinarcus sp.]|uniref:PAS domain-containing sensor histidine kinase n=1 Tax=Candidatus Marinarcus sp. TaxID=3100987 RepID=UPI003B00B86A
MSFQKEKYWIVLFIAVCISLILFGNVFYLSKNSLINSQINQIETEHEFIKKQIHDFTTDKKNQFLMMSEHKSIIDYIENPTEQNNQNVKKLFYNILKANQNMMQIRILNHLGDELIKIDKDLNNHIETISDTQLQNKAQRGYFRAFNKLKTKELGFSGLDLNQEFGVVEKPFRETIRAAMPVYTKKGSKYIIIINYYMGNWLKDFLHSSFVDIYLIDHNGYFILHANPKFNWSKYIKKPLKVYQDEEINKVFDNNFEGTQFVISNEYIITNLTFIDNIKYKIIYKTKTEIEQNLFEHLKIIAVMIVFGLFLPILPLIKIIFNYINKIQSSKETIKEKEQRLNSIFNNTFDAIIIINDNGIIEQINKATHSIFGYTKEELIGKNVNILVPEPHHHKHDNYIKNHSKEIRSKIINEQRDLFGLHKNGTQIPISLAVTQMYLNDNLFFIGTIRDVSKFKELEEKEKQQELMLMQQSKLASMGEMVAAIAHQWRQPLNSIGITIQDLSYAFKYNELNEEYIKNSQEEIMQQLNHMSQTIDEFRNFFKKSDNKEIFDIFTAIKEIIKLSWAQFKAHDISIELYYCQNNTLFHYEELDNKELKGLQIVGASADFKQVILNLINNAKDAILDIKDKKEKQNCIKIIVEDNEKEIYIKVNDLAGGILQENSSRIFEPYFTSKEMGTGLGLYISKTIVEHSFNASIRYTLTEEKINGTFYNGSSFIITMNKPKIK